MLCMQQQCAFDVGLAMHILHNGLTRHGIRVCMEAHKAQMQQKPQI